MPSEKSKSGKFTGDYLVEFLSDPEGLTDTEIDDELSKLDIDVDSIVAEVKSMVDQALEGDRLAWQEKAKHKQKSVLDLLQNLRTQLKELSREKLMEKFDEIQRKEGSELSMAFREIKPDELNDEDITDIIIDFIQLTKIDPDDQAK